MCHSIENRCRRQVEFLKRQFLQDGELAFARVLSEDAMAQAMQLIQDWRDRIYSPLVTMWVFLGQVISADHSCRSAVARLKAHRVAQGISACSSRTGAYCQARLRLPEEFFAQIARSVGRKLEDQAEPQWLWKGHHVYLFDGTTTLMPDTVENREAYPPTWNQKVNVGLPLARVAAVFSLSWVSPSIWRLRSTPERDKGR